MPELAVIHFDRSFEFPWACGPPIDMKIGLSLCGILMARGRRRSVYALDEVRPFLSLIGNARFEPIYVAPPFRWQHVTVCKLLRVRSAASTPGGSDEDGGNRRAQERFDGRCGGYKCAGREAGTATICHAAE